VLMTLLALYLAFRLVEEAGRPFPAWGKALAVVLALRPVVGDLTHGNVNLFILLLVVAGLYAFRRGRDFSAGLLLALAIACKVTPALFVPYFLWKRAWKTLAGCTAGLLLFLGAVPACCLGPARNAELLHSWYRQMIEPFVVQGVVTSEHNNQSLPGLVQRLVTHSPSFITYVNDQLTPLEYHNLLDLDPAVARGLVKGCMALFALLVVWACRTPTDRREGWRLAAEFSLVTLGMLLFSERTWKHHCVTLPFAVVAYYLSACRPGVRLRAYLFGTLAAVVLLMTTTSTGLVEELERAAKLAQAYGAYVWAYLLLAAALVVLLKTPRAEGGDEEPGTAEVGTEPAPSFHGRTDPPHQGTSVANVSPVRGRLSARD
jgi:alpha-1,2-mannosyltransferase